MTENYAELGIRFDSEPVAKQNGDNRSDKVEFHRQARILVVEDLGKFTKAFGEACVLGILDGTSVRVMAQDVNRRLLAKGAKDSEIEAAIINRLRGVRNASRGGTTKVTVYVLPDGSTYSGSDLVEYQQAFAAALVNVGMDGTSATQIASTKQLPSN